MSTSYKDINERAEHIKAICHETILSLLAIQGAEIPAGPVPQVHDRDKRDTQIDEALATLGGKLSRVSGGHNVAKGLVAAVRVIRGERAETIYEYRYLRTRTALVAGKPDRVEIECNEVERKKDYGK